MEELTVALTQLIINDFWHILFIIMMLCIRDYRLIAACSVAMRCAFGNFSSWHYIVLLLMIIWVWYFGTPRDKTAEQNPKTTGTTPNTNKGKIRNDPDYR